MKALIVVLCTTAATLALPASADEPTPARSAVAAPRLDPGVVPRGRTYALLDGGGRKIADFFAGQKTPMAVTDCAQVPCPPTFGKDVVCWKCKERLKSN